MRIALVSRELHPVGGGGIGVAVAGIAAALTELGEVTILTRSGLEEDYHRLRFEGTYDWPDEVQVEFVLEPEPHDIGSYYNYMHHYSARVYERLRELYPDGGPDVVEFAGLPRRGPRDRSGAPLVRRLHARTRCRCRAHTTSAEICGVLDGFVDDGLEVRALLAAERHVLREADRILWPGGDVLATYERFYGRGELAPAEPGARPDRTPARPPPPARPAPAGEELRLLYLGRLERRKGVQRPDPGAASACTADELVADARRRRHGHRAARAVDARASSSWPRPETIADPRSPAQLPRAELARLLADSHVLVCPSLWECWPSVVLEALAAGRPVLGTPTGGLVEMLATRGAGWLTEDVRRGSPRTRRRTPARARATQVDELIASGAPRRVYAELTDAGAFRGGVPRPRRSRARGASGEGARWRAPQPLVSVVIPYFRLDRYVGETVRVGVRAGAPSGSRSSS